MILPPGVTCCGLDDVDVVGDDLSVFLTLSDGSIVAVCLPIAELIGRGHVILSAEEARAFVPAAAH